MPREPSAPPSARRRLEAAEELRATAGDGTPLYVRRRAGPRPLTALLCDGLGCDGYVFRHLFDDLAKHLSVAHWHYRGHGRSAAPRDVERVAVEDTAGDLLRVADALDASELVLVGHSYGTQVALEAYRLAPERIRGLVLLCGVEGRVTESFAHGGWLGRALPGLRRWVEEHPRLARGIWSGVPPRLALRIGILTGQIAADLPSDDVLAYFDHVTSVDLALFLRMLHHAGTHSAADLLPQITAPVFVGVAERDHFTPAERGVAMAERIPGAVLWQIAGASHAAPLERPTELAARLRDFLVTRGLA